MFKLNKTNSIVNESITLLLCSSVIIPVYAQDYIAPLMTDIPAGTFMMGVVSGEDKAKPIHSVTLPEFQLGTYPVTVKEFRKFIESSGYQPSQTCNDFMGSNWFNSPDSNEGSASWDKHRFQNNDYQPVTCVTFQDATAYTTWISEKTGTTYRLPTEQEWEYAEKANTTSKYFWGDDPNLTEACKYGNFADHSGEYFSAEEYGASYVGFIEHANCDDGEAYTSIVGLYRPNPFGLYDMVGNISQYLSSCFYEGYKKRSTDEMDINKCEYISHRNETWHFPPQPHADRGRTKRIDETPWALMGFRLAADGHNSNADSSTKIFELTLKKEQKSHLSQRKKLPSPPKQLQLVNTEEDLYKLSWQPAEDPDVTAYYIYLSKTPYSHMQGGYFKRHYDKIQTLPAEINSTKVSLPKLGGSFKVVAVTKSLTSLPSKAAHSIPPSVVTLPGRILMNNNSELKNVLLAHRKATAEKPELYYFSKFNTGYEQPLVSATFKVVVKKTGWYNINYYGRSRVKGEMFKLWQNDTLLTQLNYDPEIDDKTSNRHKVFLEKGSHQLQLTSVKEAFDYWSFAWLDFSEIVADS